MALLALIARQTAAQPEPTVTPYSGSSQVDPVQYEAPNDSLLYWPVEDIALVGAAMAIFWVLAKVCARFVRAEFWLVAALIPCWQLAFAIGLHSEALTVRSYLGGILVSTLWWFLSGRARTNPPFNPGWIVAIPVSGLILLSVVNWNAIGIWWPIVVALGHLAVIGLLWAVFGSRSTVESKVVVNERPSEPPAPEAAAAKPEPEPRAAPHSAPPPAASVRTARLFISYRREDSPDVAGRIYDRLVQRFGKEQVFKDVDSIPLGVDFRKHLHQVVGNCDLVLAVLGRDWLNAANAAGARRLDDLKDFVRIELEAALQRDIPVIPILVRGASVPLETDLPESLAPFAYRNGIPVRADPDFHHDMDRLIEGVEAHLSQRAP